MPLRAFKFSVGLLPLLVANALAMPAAPEMATTFALLTDLLPCQTDISVSATSFGYREVAQTQIDIDYSDIEYSDALGQSLLTVALENTPIGAQFSVQLDVSETDQTFADAVVTALRRNWSLPEAVHLQSLASGTAQFWVIQTTHGAAHIVVHHDNMNTRISGILQPLARGAPLPC
jgi:hypothetical protein